MKSCIQCGENAFDDAAHCADCGRQFSYVSGQPLASEASLSSTKYSNRPSGEGVKTSGIIFVVLGVGFVLAGTMTNATSSAQLDPIAAIMTKFGMIWLGGGLFQLGLIFWAVGYIVQAISFLPGRDD